MGFTHFFVDRPIFAAVLSVFITLAGALAYFTLPVSQYPQIAPPTVTVTATYPGANAELAAEAVAAPIELEINGVDNMIYLTSQVTGDGRVSISVVFRPGTDVDQAQVLVQNRVAIAEPRLPEEVRRLGVTTRKSSPDILMVIFLVADDPSLDRLYVSNYAIRNVRDVLARVDGVGTVSLFGAREYSMRVWLDPDKVAARGLTAGEVVAALRAQNLQVSTGTLNQPTGQQDGAFQMSLQARGRLSTPEQFGEVILRTTPDGGVLRLKELARVELGASDYSTNAYLSNKDTVGILINEKPGSNSLAVANTIKATMDRLAKDFPAGLRHDIGYNPTEFVETSIAKVYTTIYEAIALVILVVLLFLQSWRAALIPILAIPVSLVGTFAVMALLGFSLNTLSLFGLILAVGIVVDDAIVVVENVETNLSKGMSPKEAAHKTMDEVSGALLAIALVLSAVFIPTAFITGVSGAFYTQFAVTISVATLISCFVSLTLSPALSALLLRPHAEGHDVPRWQRPITGFFNGFNRGFDWLSRGYGSLVRRMARFSVLVLFVYTGLLALTGWQLMRTPTGFIPAQDRGFALIAYQLPSGASLARTDVIARRAQELVLGIEGIAATPTFVGFSGATFTNEPNAAVTFVTFKPFAERTEKGLTQDKLVAQMRQRLAGIDGAFIIVIPPPAVSGLGNGGGFKMMVQDRAGLGTNALYGAVFQMMIQAQQVPEVRSVFTSFEVSTPQVVADIDRSKAEILGVPVSSVFDALAVNIGSTYVNDFALGGRTYRVTAQAEYQQRLSATDVGQLLVRNRAGDMVPLASLATFSETTGAFRTPRHNLYPAAELQGESAPGISSTQALAAMEALAARVLPQGISFEWTELAYQQRAAGNTAIFVFALAILFVFLVLAAQYESLSLPFAVILIVPMCLLAGITGIVLRGFDNNIITQIGFVVLVGLAAKNAILIVEFAKEARDSGEDSVEAAASAARQRLRPIIMTSLAFILGVLPLVIATGAGAETRQILGTVVFAGMLGVTVFGLIFTPIFFVVIDRLFGGKRLPDGKAGGSHRPAPKSPIPATVPGE
jgi:hydrophobic/amphiphilic exporter-1 (mainly G- bacteria), HAE1 family